MEWFDFEKKRPFVGETILLCWSIPNSLKQSVIYKCVYEKFSTVTGQHRYDYYNKKLQFSDLVLISGNFFCKQSERASFPFEPSRFRWARLN